MAQIITITTNDCYCYGLGHMGSNPGKQTMVNKRELTSGSPGCPFNQNALLKGHLKGTFLFKKGQKEGKKGANLFF